MLDPSGMALQDGGVWLGSDQAWDIHIRDRDLFYLLDSQGAIIVSLLFSVSFLCLYSILPRLSIRLSRFFFVLFPFPFPFLKL